MKDRLRTNRIFIIVVISLVVAGALLFLPSRRQRREIEFRTNLARTATFADTADLARLKEVHEFVIPSRTSPKKGDLYLFVPAQNNNIAVVSTPTFNPFLNSDFRDVAVHVIPAQAPQSPATSLALKLALASPGHLGQTFIDQVGQHPRTALKVLSEAWTKVPAAKQDTIEAQVQSNHERSLQAGAYQAVLQYGTYAIKGASWQDLRNPISEIRFFYDGRR